MILLHHEGMNSTITTPARLGREQHAPRRYQAEGHWLELNGPGHIIAHDAEEICKIPGYRLATPQECDAYATAQRGETAIHETLEENAPSELQAAPTRGRKRG